MKGIVFKLLGDLVRRDFGDDAWDDLIDAARASGAYTSLGSYEDEALHRLVAAASAALGRLPTGLLRWYGRGAMPMLAQAYPHLFAAPGRLRVEYRSERRLGALAERFILGAPAGVRAAPLVAA